MSSILSFQLERFSLSIFDREVLLVVTYLSFCLFGNLLVSIPFWRKIFVSVELLFQSFLLSALWVSYHSSFWLYVSNEKAAINVTGDYWCLLNHFFLVFKILSSWELFIGFFLEMESHSHSVARAGVQWCNLVSLQPATWVQVIILPQPLK